MLASIIKESHDSTSLLKVFGMISHFSVDIPRLVFHSVTLDQLTLTLMKA
jgi:hypothetical protein